MSRGSKICEALCRTQKNIQNDQRIQKIAKNVRIAQNKKNVSRSENKTNVKIVRELKNYQDQDET